MENFNSITSEKKEKLFKRKTLVKIKKKKVRHFQMNFKEIISCLG